MQPVHISGLNQPLFLETSEQAVPLNAVRFHSQLQQRQFDLPPDKENLPTRSAPVITKTKSARSQSRSRGDRSMFAIL